MVDLARGLGECILQGDQDRMERVGLVGRDGPFGDVCARSAVRRKTPIGRFPNGKFAIDGNGGETYGTIDESKLTRSRVARIARVHL